jgi:hypothetical protein
MITEMRMMKMNEYNDSFFEDPWENIKQPNYPKVNLLFFDDERFYVSLNERNQKLLVIQVPIIVKEELPSDLKSVDIEIVKFDNNKTRLLCILKEEALVENFTLVVKDVAYRCKDYSDKDLIKKAIKRICDWTELLKASRNGIGKSKQIGLWGELFILNEYVSEIHPIKDAVNFWIGPDDKKHDFTFNKLALEIKTKMSGSRATIKITSIDQLKKVTERLYLIQVVINKGNQSDSFSLKDLHDRIMVSINNDHETKAHFLNKIQKLYFGATEKEQDEKFKPLDFSVYEIDEKFPLIQPDTLPNSVISLEYEIDEAKIVNNKIHDPIEEIIKDV